MKSIFLVIALTCCCSCSVQEQVSFKNIEEGKTIKYLIDAPQGFKISTVTDYHGKKETHLRYPDGSIIYITNDEKSGGEINKAKVQKYGDDIYIRMLMSDSLDIRGNDDGKYWREMKLNKIVAGYLNTPVNKRDEYDKVLETLKKK